jgi:signal transduction histidine kinase
VGVSCRARSGAIATGIDEPDAEWHRGHEEWGGRTHDVVGEVAEWATACFRQDAGVCVPNEKFDLLLSAFYTTKREGTGVRPAISRSIVEILDGRLWATADSPRDATFHFTVPHGVQE